MDEPAHIYAKLTPSIAKAKALTPKDDMHVIYE